MKGQLMIDVLMMVLSFSVILIAVFGTSSFDTDQLAYRHDYSVNQKTLISVLQANYTLNSRTGRGIDFLVTGDSLADLSQQMNQTLYQLNKGERNYILYSPGRLWAYDKQPTVCMEQIPVARMEYETNSGEKITVLYGSWPSWMELPETC